MNNHILQVNLKNRGGAFSIIYEASKVIYPKVIFDYFSDGPFFKDSIYDYLVDHESVIFDKEITGNRFLKQIKLYKEFISVLSKGNYAAVHINTDTAWKALIYFIGAKKMNVKNVIIHSHSSGINGHYHLLNYILHVVSRNYIKNASCKCACSIKAAEWMYGESKGVNIINNGVDLDKYQYREEKRKELQGKFNIHEDKVVVGTVGDYSYAKNPEFLYKIIKGLANNEQYIFVLIGESYGKKKILDKLHDKDVCNIIDIGQVTNVEDYLSLIDIFILPSRFEGIPMSALEAQATGCYTLVSDNVASETSCSKYYESIRLDDKQWIEKILGIRVDYDRKKTCDYLDINKISINKAGNQLRKLYHERLGL